jgi:hypothetical protein
MDKLLANRSSLGGKMAKNADIYGTFEELISSIEPEMGPICRALREMITALHIDFVEIVWINQQIASYGVGPKKMSEHYVYIGAHKRHVNLGFYHGASLPDPEGLLEGTGKRLRHVKIGSVSEVASPHVQRLVQAAIADRQSR